MLFSLALFFHRGHNSTGQQSPVLSNIFKALFSCQCWYCPALPTYARFIHRVVFLWGLLPKGAGSSTVLPPPTSSGLGQGGGRLCTSAVHHHPCVNPPCASPAVLRVGVREETAQAASPAHPHQPPHLFSNKHRLAIPLQSITPHSQDLTKFLTPGIRTSIEFEGQRCSF